MRKNKVIMALSLAVVFLFGLVVLAQGADINLAEAIKVIKAAEAKAKEIGVQMNIAVVDTGGNLIAFERMDNAWLGSIDIAINKAFTAICFAMSTEALGKEAQPGKSLYGIQNTNKDRIVIFGGGIPLKKNGELFGAIGISGGAVSQDISVALAGVAGVEAFK